ncbi:MAG: GNAT family N-acetyltransferase [Treponema sp.]|nr:GNAT family N-acetyltransferase [Treponema sp.]
MAFDEHLDPFTLDNYTVRLCKNEEELRQYQDLRYKHLILEFDPEKAKTATAGETDDNMGYDKNTVQLCAFCRDPITGIEEVVGGYIMMRFKKDDDFCKATLKYDMSNLFKYKFEVCEVTRGVTRPDHRNGVITKLLWDGIDAYVRQNKLRFIVGTMSFMGIDPLIYTDGASYLHHNYRMPDEIMVRPIESNAYYHNYIKKEDISRRTAIRQLPPLLRGMLMIGAQTGDGFYIDKELGVVETFASIDTHKETYKLENFGRAII